MTTTALPAVADLSDEQMRTIALAALAEPAWYEAERDAIDVPLRAVSEAECDSPWCAHNGYVADNRPAF